MSCWPRWVGLSHLKHLGAQMAERLVNPGERCLRGARSFGDEPSIGRRAQAMTRGVTELRDSRLLSVFPRGLSNKDAKTEPLGYEPKRL